MCLNRSAFFLVIAFFPLISHAQSRFPAAATTAKARYDRDIGANSASYQQTTAAAKKAYEAKLATAKAEYDARNGKARGNYVATLESIVASESRAGRRDSAQAVQFTLNQFKVPPRTDIQMYWTASFAAEQQQDYDRAIDQVKLIVKKTGDYSNAYAWLRFGWLNYLKKDYENSETAYRRAAKNAPVAVTPLTGLINCHKARNETDEAIKVAKTLLDVDPINYYANKTLGDLYYQKKDYKSSAVYYYKLATAYPEDLEMATSLGWSYYNMGQVPLAKTVFTNVIAIIPGHVSANTGFAACVKAEKR